MVKRNLFLSIGLSVLLLLQSSTSSVVFAAPLRSTASAVSRIAGANRYDTSIAISQKGWTHADNVIIATGLDYPDALSASALSRTQDAPILLSDSDSLNSPLIAELKRLGASRVTLIGGTGVLKPSIESELKEIGIVVTRIGGVDRYDTSKQIANVVGINSEIAVATGSDFPDALSIAPIAAVKSMPILLSRKTGLDSNMTDLIKNKIISHSYIIGGTGVLGTSIDTSVPNSKRLFGGDRYGTNLDVNTEFASSLNFDTVYLATGQDFPDALSGSALAAKNNAPILLTEKDSISVDTINFLKAKNVKKVIILGGTGVVSKNVENLINASLSPDSVIDVTSSFTDPNFKNHVYNQIGKVSPAPILYSDVKGILTLDVYKSNIKSLSGIEFFTSLRTLNCYVNHLTDLDISHNSALTELDCDGNEITSLDVSHNTALSFLWCASNGLRSLDVSKNTALYDLNCAINNLTSLDVSHNTNLLNLNCEVNRIATLDITHNTTLNNFLCSANCLTTLDISKNKNLADYSPDYSFSCVDNEIKTLYASNNNFKPSDYRPQYTDHTHTKFTNALTLTIKN